jgi:hypothetical protein
MINAVMIIKTTITIKNSFFFINQLRLYLRLLSQALTVSWKVYI